MIPIRVKQFPAFLSQALERTKVLQSKKQKSRTFHLCYFSCHSYFKYLYCALHSVVNQIHDIPYKILIFNDNDQPLSEAQILAIQQLLPDVQVIPWPKSMGWGAEQISWIWKAYAKAAESADDEDIIARVDSDVFFFNDLVFRAVECSDADLIGDGHFVDFKYAQGGCYFFKASAVNRINEMLNTESVDKISNEVDVVVEDVMAHHFAKRLNLKVWLIWFMMFPDELRNAGSLNSWARWKFSCLHFVMKNKMAMLDAYEREVLKGQNLQQYKKILETE